MSDTPTCTDPGHNFHLGGYGSRITWEPCPAVGAGPDTEALLQPCACGRYYGHAPGCFAVLRGAGPDIPTETRRPGVSYREDGSVAYDPEAQPLPSPEWVEMAHRETRAALDEDGFEARAVPDEPDPALPDPLAQLLALCDQKIRDRSPAPPWSTYLDADDVRNYVVRVLAARPALPDDTEALSDEWQVRTKPLDALEWVQRIPVQNEEQAQRVARICIERRDRDVEIERRHVTAWVAAAASTEGTPA